MLKPACDKSQSFGLLYWRQKKGFEKKKKKLKNTVLIHPGINTFWFVSFCDLCWKRPLPTELLCSTWAPLISDFAPCSWPLWSAQRQNSNPFSTKEVKMSPSFSANSPQWVYFFFCLHSKHLIKHLEKLVSLQLPCLPSSPSLVCDLTGSNAELCSWICRQPATTALRHPKRILQVRDEELRHLLPVIFTTIFQSSILICFVWLQELEH